jgi:hypothetical protein
MRAPLPVLVIDEQPVWPTSTAPQMSAMQEIFKILMSLSFLVE